MIKTILKETIIILLICIAILLILGVVFYDYNPLNKILPNKVAYSTPEEIKKEIQEKEVKDILESEYNVVYSIDSTDMNIYRKENSYVAGKLNPFSTIEEDSQGTSQNGQASTNNGQTSNSANNSKPSGTNNVTGRK